MANLRVTLKNPPQGLANWHMFIFSGKDRAVKRFTPWIAPGATAQFDLPADWVFPAGFWIVTGGPHWKTMQNLIPAREGYVDCPGVPGLGNQTFDWAAGRFVVRPPIQENVQEIIRQPWIWLVLVVIIIGIVLASKRK